MFKTVKNSVEFSDLELTYSKLNDKAKEILDKKMMDVLQQYVDCVEESESPIEEILYVALRSVMSKNPDFVDVRMQEEVSVNGMNYRIDLLVVCYDGKNGRYYAIECDGHDFHEKTKEQAARDKKRDRDLMSAGYHVIRFTGSEIYNNPLQCATEVRKIAFGGFKIFGREDLN